MQQVKINDEAHTWREWFVIQSKLKSKLHTDAENYYTYRRLKVAGVVHKCDISLKKLQQQQAAVNRIRIKLGKTRIAIVQNLKIRIKAL